MVSSRYDACVTTTLLPQVKPELVQVSQAPVGESYARLDYHEECEAGVNEQIK